MSQETYEIRTRENVKVGDIGVCNGELVVVVKHGRHIGVISMEDIAQQMVGDDVDFRIMLYGNINRRIAIVQARREILRLPTSENNNNGWEDRQD